MAAAANSGSVTVQIDVAPEITGLTATGAVGTVFLWGDIVPDPGTNYSPLDPSQTPNWVTIDPSAAGSYSAISPAPGSVWTEIDPESSPSWEEVA